MTGIVRERGVFGNWALWAFLLTGSVTTFFFAALWRRSGVLSLLVTSLVAASMSTMSTAVNWGSNVVVNDVNRWFVDPGADQRRQVWVGRLATAGLMIVSCGLALLVRDTVRVFEPLLQFGAGTGLASTLSIWAALFAAGHLLYGHTATAGWLAAVAGAGAVVVRGCWPRLSFR